MRTLAASVLSAYRAQTFRLTPALRVGSPQEARAWVEERGFVHFWPIRGVVFPNLWTAVAGERPVADAHDDPGHITWGWKDEALGKRVWYYGKVLRRKATLISLEIAPYFYALTENYGSPEEDHLPAYQEGRMTAAAKRVYEALLDGPLNTIDLRKAAQLSSKQSDSEFNKAIETLQADFKILPVGVAQAGAWNYAFIYAVTAHHFPQLPEKARRIGEAEARENLLKLYFESVGAATLREAVKLFGWGPDLTQRALKRLTEQGKLSAEVTVENQPGAWFALSRLV